MCKSFLFFRSLVLKRYLGFEPRYLEWKSNTLNQTMLITQYLPYWSRTSVIFRCKRNAINQLGEGELVAGVGADPTATKI